MLNLNMLDDEIENKNDDLNDEVKEVIDEVSKENHEENKEDENIGFENVASETSDVSDDKLTSVTVDLSNDAEKEKLADAMDGIYNKDASTENAIKKEFVPLMEVGDDFESFKNSIEEKRKEYVEIDSKKKRVSRISSIVIAVFLVAALIILILSNVKNGENKLIPQTWIPITVVSIAAACSIGMSIFSYIYNKKYSTNTRKYFDVYQNAVAAYLLKPLDISEGKIAVDGKLSDNLLIQAHYFSTIVAINSRALVVAKRKDDEINFGEIACSIPNMSEEQTYQLPTLYNFQTDEEIPYQAEIYKESNDNNKRSAFEARNPEMTGLLGRLLSLSYKVESSASFIVVFRGDKKNTIMPTNVNKYKAYKDERLKDNIVLYLASDDAKFAFSDETMAILNDVVIDDVVTSGFVSVNSYGTEIVLNISDALMTLPTDKPVDQKAVETARDDFKILVSFIDALEK